MDTTFKMTFLLTVVLLLVLPTAAAAFTPSQSEAAYQWVKPAGNIVETASYGSLGVDPSHDYTIAYSRDRRYQENIVDGTNATTYVTIPTSGPQNMLFQNGATGTYLYTTPALTQVIVGNCNGVPVDTVVLRLHLPAGVTNLHFTSSSTPFCYDLPTSGASPIFNATGSTIYTTGVRNAAAIPDNGLPTLLTESNIQATQVDVTNPQNRFVWGRLDTTATQTWDINFTQADVGGAYYAFIAEVQGDSNLHQSVFSSDLGGSFLSSGTMLMASGSANSGLCNSVTGHAGTPQCQIYQYRVGYVTPPLNATRQYVITFTNHSGTNSFFTGVLAAGQPSLKPNVYNSLAHPAHGTTNDIALMDFYSLDSFNYTFTGTVYKCGSQTVLSVCNNKTTTPLPNATYQYLTGGTILNGVTDAAGRFTISGQFLDGTTGTLTLIDPGYATNTYSLTFPSNSPGSYASSFYLGPTGASGVIVGTASLSVTFSGNFTRVVPDAVNITITRNAGIEAGVDCILTTPSGGFRKVCTAADWTATSSNTYYFHFPQNIRNYTTAQDAGNYILYVEQNGSYVGSHTFCIETTYSPSCNVTASTTFLQQLSNTTNGQLASIASQNQAQSTITQEKSVQSYYLDALSFAFSSDLFQIPNIAWFYLATLVIVGVSAMARRT